MTEARKMRTDEKRTLDLSPDDVQSGNRGWWTSNPMAYDWHGEIEHERFSREWFDQIDARFIYGSRLFATKDQPFDRILPFDRLRGRRVLEIGCGMGLHTELMVRAGADLVSIDLSPTSVEATTRRLALKGLKSRVEIMDAERLAFDEGAFDFVWSWGVIHHSARTARVVRGIRRVLADDGQARVMVYNREGASAKVNFLTSHVLRGGFLKRSFEETLFQTTDGFSARYYVREQFEDLFRAFFDDVSAEIIGQDVDAVPLPRQLRKYALQLLPKSYLEAAQARRGGFIFLRAARPV
jgi:2-polyprenyl-3-methyl-5-hydroxy-6-metoxy-1,4-benzoquinol methylase